MTEQEKLQNFIRYEMSKHYLANCGDIGLMTKLKDFYFQRYGFKELKRFVSQVEHEIAEFQMAEVREKTGNRWPRFSENTFSC